MESRVKELRAGKDSLSPKHLDHADFTIVRSRPRGLSCLILPNPGIKNKITQRTPLVAPNSLGPGSASVPLASSTFLSTAFISCQLIASRDSVASRPQSCPIVSHSGLIGPFRTKQYRGRGVVFRHRSGLLTTDY